MRMSDWSSDVCSSDLGRNLFQKTSWQLNHVSLRKETKKSKRSVVFVASHAWQAQALRFFVGTLFNFCCSLTVSRSRSEERSVGKECVSTGRSRWLRLY